jgi:hypothetical protein
VDVRARKEPANNARVAAVLTWFQAAGFGL